MICEWCGMAGCHYSTQPEATGPVEVAAIEDMDNRTFLKHMDLRHKDDVLCWPLEDSPDQSDAWVGPYRAFHDRLHELHHGEIDHRHLW